MYKRFNELLELRKASVVKPEATAVKAPAVNIPQPSSVAQNSGAVTSQGDRKRVAPGNGIQASGPCKQQDFRRPNAVCWRCGKPGHIQRNCRLPAFEPPRKLPSAVNRGSRGLEKANVYFHMQLNGRMLPCLLDSGCEVTLVSKAVVKAASNVKMLPSSQRL